MPRSLPARLRLRRALVEAVPVGELLRARHGAGEVAGIVDLAGRRLVGQRLRLDEVPAADRIGRDAEIARDGVDQPLDQIGRLRPPGAAIGIDRHRVGVDAAQAHMRSRDVVEPGRHADAEPGNVRRVGRQIGAHVGDDVELEREEPALVVDGERRGRDIVAAMAVAEEMLGCARRSISPACAGASAATAASAYSR